MRDRGRSPGIIRLVLLCAALVGRARVLGQTTDALGFEPRTYNGTNNNLDYPLWGSVNTSQIRAIAGANYSDGFSAVSGTDRPSAREVSTEVFLSASAVGAPQSALFVAWGLLISYDIASIADDETSSFDVPCDEGGGFVDVWCPEGTASDDISFYRSQASESETTGVRNPTNLATSYLDLDFMYGRSEADAMELRTMEDGLMMMTDDDMPIENDDGTWLIGDQRTAELPVTFALHIVLLREHNICCRTIAPDLGYETDEEIYQACRGWTIAVYQHVTDNDFNIRLTGTDILREYEPLADSIVSSSYSTSTTSSSPVSESDSSPAEETSTPDSLSTTSTVVSSEASEASSAARSRRSRRRLHDLYTGDLNPSADVFATTVGTVAFHGAIPPTVRIMSENFRPAPEDGIELTEAAEDIAGLFERNDVGNIVRGAVFSSSLAVDAHFSAAVSTTSPLFKLPVDAVQRGRDHGIPTYNDAREAYGLSRATSFAEVSSDSDVAALLEAAYGGDVGNLDAVTGALAEGSGLNGTAVLGSLFQEVWKDQLYRTIVGDRLFHRHDVLTTDAENQTLHDVVERTLNVTDLPLSLFTIPDIKVCYANCGSSGTSTVSMSDEFTLAWILDDDYITYTLSAKYIGDEGYMGIGLGGDEMADVEDFLICEVLSATEAECLDYQPVSGHTTPDEDSSNTELVVTDISVEDDWTSVTFYRYKDDLDDSEDYNLYDDLDGETSTDVIFAYRSGDGVGKHANSNRGASSVNFVTGESSTICEEDSDFYLLHGALILFAWLVLLPLGIFFARYRKGEKMILGSQWWEMHASLMIVASELVLPLSITALFATSGTHKSSHAKWGIYMIVALAMQILTGVLRQRALEGKQSNFCLLHRINKHFHIWTGHFAFLAGTIQCYRGLELVSATDSLHFSAIEDIVEFEIGNFGVVYDYVMPVWCAVTAALFLFLEIRKQLSRYSKKGAAMVCCVYEVRNKNFVAIGHEVDDEGGPRLMPRTQALPIYTLAEFNNKVLHGQSWVIVDGAILDVSTFSRRHPGGARVIVNILGTDATSWLKGEDLAEGMTQTFTPHVHSEAAWELARSLVVGYIDEEDETDSESDGEKEGFVDAGDRRRSRTESSGGGGGGGGPFRNGASANPWRRLRDRAIQKVSSVSAEGGSAGDPSNSGGADGSAAASSSAAAGSNEYGREEKATTEAAMRAAMYARAWAKKAKRRGSVSGVPMSPIGASPVPAAAAAFLAGLEKKMERGRQSLERFHVCPFVRRERMGQSADRPVYSYVFACPGEAQVLAKAATGVCYFSMRIVRSNGESLVQRSYNATAVRVVREQDAKVGGAVTAPEDNVATDRGTPEDVVAASGRRGNPPALAEKNAVLRVVPAVESRDGALCVEMRIRLYEDGAMSKLLDDLPNDASHGAVQLQGPYLVEKLSPPPAHRNVIMIAAGTGVNPMVQLIRDYQSFDSQDSLRTTGRSRLALLWQVTSAADLYCMDELKSLEARGRGLLEVTALISDTYRKTNDPKAPNAFQRRRRRGRAAVAAAAASARRAASGANSGSSTPAYSAQLSRNLSGARTLGSTTNGGSGTLGFIGRLLPGLSRDKSSLEVSSRASPEAAAAVAAPADGSGAIPAMDDRERVGLDEGDARDTNTPGKDAASAEPAAAGPGTTNERDALDGSPGTGAPPVEAVLEAANAGHEEARSDSQQAAAAAEASDPPRRAGALQSLLPGRKGRRGGGNSAHTVKPNDAIDMSLSGLVANAGKIAKPREVKLPSRDTQHGTLAGAQRPVGRMTSEEVAPIPFARSYESCASMTLLNVGPTTGKVSKEHIKELLGGSVLQSLQTFQEKSSGAHSQQSADRLDRQADIDALCGTGEEAGKLQVVVSGPSGFVFHVNTMLEDLGVPKEAIVLLD